MMVVFMLMMWFGTIAVMRPEARQYARTIRLVDGGALNAFKTARREIERWESLPAEQSFSPRL
jgi:hypothetical protein